RSRVVSTSPASYLAPRSEYSAGHSTCSPYALESLGATKEPSMFSRSKLKKMVVLFLSVSAITLFSVTLLSAKGGKGGGGGEGNAGNQIGIGQNNNGGIQIAGQKGKGNDGGENLNGNENGGGQSGGGGQGGNGGNGGQGGGNGGGGNGGGGNGGGT